MNEFNLESESDHYSIYSITSADGKMALKVLNSSREETKQRLYNELEIGQMIRHHGFRRTTKETLHSGKHAILMEWADGYPLSTIISNKIFSVKEFLTVARDIVSALIAMHSKSIAHTNLTCDHIIFNPDSHSVKLIGVGSSVNVERGKTCITKQDLLEKDLHYTSPEMGSRFNQYFDLRSDLYSIGVIFYIMLTGQYPLHDNDKMKIILLHVSQEALPVRYIDPNIPTAVSDMISKLLNKNLGGRYQTAKGLIFDLDSMLSEIDSDTNLSDIVLGENDISPRIQDTNMLYGRADDFNTLVAALNRLSYNSVEAVFLSGMAGTGKSSLITEFYKLVTNRNGVLIYGAYDYTRKNPFSVLIDAANDFCEVLLLSNEVIRSSYRTQIQQAVGEEGKLLTDIIPSLHLIIGQQSPVSDSIGQDAKNRLKYVFAKFINSICSLDSPILLVLEDLQLLDEESLDLLSYVITNKDLKNLMLIGTYRQNEVSGDHSALRLIQNIKMSRISTTNIELKNFSLDSVNDFISDTLKTPLMKSLPLSVFIHKKTEGNPFFVSHILKSFVESGIIFYSNENCTWTWDESQFDDNDISADVHQLLRNKILSFDENTREILIIASCLGSPFYLNTLKVAVNNSDIKSALYTEMIVPFQGNEIFRFSHDKIQHAVFSLISNDSEIFYHIAMKLWNNLPKEEIELNLFPLVNLFSRALDSIKDETMRLEIASLFFSAGKKAIMLTAFEIGYRYLETGIKLLSSNSWEDDFDFTMMLYDAASKAAFCAKQFDRMENLLDVVIERSPSIEQIAQSFSVRIYSYKERLMFRQTIEAGMKFLSIVDYKLNYSGVESEIETAINLFCNMEEQEILSKTMIDEVTIATMKILHDISRIAWDREKSPRYALISAQMVQLTCKYGVSKYSPASFSTFGAALCTFGDYELGYKFGRFAISLLEIIHEKDSIPSTMMIFYTYINPTFHSIRDSLSSILESYEKLKELGSYDGCRMTAYIYLSFGLEVGNYLPTLMDEIEDFKETYPVLPKFMFALFQVVMNLIGKNNGNPAVLSGSLYDVMTFDGSITSQNGGILCLCRYLAYLFYDYDTALSFTEKIKSYSTTITFLFTQHGYLEFYDSLVSLALARNHANNDTLIKFARISMDKLRIRSTYSPYCLNKLFLLEAELEALGNNKTKAESKYTEAIAYSKKHEFVNEEALACERAGIFFLETKSLEKGYKYLVEALKCYKRWGCAAKMEHLINTYSCLQNKINEPLLDVVMDMSDLKLEQQSIKHGSIEDSYQKEAARF